MTRRERLESKLEKRQEWAAGRREKAATIHRFTGQFRGDHAFNTQPGHIPIRARVIRMDERAYEHTKMAGHHDTKAAGLATQLERSVFSDDADAIEQLQGRINEHEAARDRMKLVNKLYKKGDAAGLAALGIDLERLKVKLAEAGSYWGSKPHLPYELTNLGARIRSDHERIAAIKARRERATRAETAGGLLVEGDEWVRVTFAEKPPRETILALREAGFNWGDGHWTGRREKLPDAVRGMIGA
jgi:hypothetical protein